MNEHERTRQIDAELAGLDAIHDAIVARSQREQLCVMCRYHAPRRNNTALCGECYSEANK